MKYVTSKMSVKIKHTSVYSTHSEKYIVMTTIHGENFMAIFTPLSVVTWVSTLLKWILSCKFNNNYYFVTVTWSNCKKVFETLL